MPKKRYVKKCHVPQRRFGNATDGIERRAYSHFFVAMADARSLCPRDPRALSVEPAADGATFRGAALQDDATHASFQAAKARERPHSSCPESNLPASRATGRRPLPRSPAPAPPRPLLFLQPLKSSRPRIPFSGPGTRAVSLRHRPLPAVSHTSPIFLNRGAVFCCRVCASNHGRDRAADVRLEH